MKKYVYPAVFYYDEHSKLYCAAIEDLALYIDGETVEQAHTNAAEVLQFFISTTLRYGDDVPAATAFADVVAANPKRLVMLVECQL